MKKTKGFKCFNKDFTCLNFKFKVGKTFTHSEDIVLCKSGFHFCQELKDVFGYYSFDKENHICEVEALGEILTEGNKSVCKKIKIIRELSWDEVLLKSNLGTNNLGYGNAGNVNAGNGNAGNGNAGNDNAGNVNAGNGNAGNGNAGHYNAGNVNAGNGNAGNRNAGYRNAGYRNAGNVNAGNGNAGNVNAGNGNAGNGNAGHYNAGNGNAGNGNAGHYNAGNGNVGLFNSNPGKLRLFNKETNVKWEDSRIQNAIKNSPNFQEYVYFSNMSEEEKKLYPYAKTTGGYYKQLDYKDAWIKFWGNAQDDVKKAFLQLPNFNAKVFESITGIKVK